MFAGMDPIRAPIANGNIRLIGLKVGADNEGDIRAEVASDGQNAHVTLNSEMSKGKLTGQLDYRIDWRPAISPEF